MSDERPGMVLRWLAAVIDALAETRPGNHTRILAVAAALLSHADPDGSHCRPGQRLLAAETGQHLGRVSESMTWLEERGWLTMVRRIEHGGREYQLSVPEGATLEVQRSAGSNADSVPEGATLEVQRPGSVRVASGQRSGASNEPPTSYLQPARAGGDFHGWALERCAAKGGGPGLLRKILAEDRWIFDAESEGRLKTERQSDCHRCDQRGFIVDDEGLPIEPIEQCDHLAALSPEPRQATIAEAAG